MSGTVGSTALLEMLEKLESLPQALTLFGQDLVEQPDFAEVVTGLVIEQHEAGERSDGSAIDPPYTPYTVRIKKQKGQPTDRVTLEDTGDYHAEMRVKVYENKVEVFSTNEKQDVYGNTFNTGEALAAKYNDNDGDIHGLQEESKERTRTFMKPDFYSFIRHYFNLA